MADDTIQDQRVFLSLMPATRRDYQVTLVAGLIAAGVFAAAIPFATTQLPRVEAFIPGYQAALMITDLITAALLYGQFSILNRRGLLLLASGYLFCGLMVIAHTLSFPGLLADAGVIGGGPQTTAWLFMFWHGGFPLLVIGYALDRGRGPRGAAPAESGSAPGARRAILFAGGAVAAAALALTLLVTAGHDAMPAIMSGHGYTPLMIAVVGTVWGLSTVACVVLLLRRPHSALDLWLVIVTIAWQADIGLSAVFNAGRFDLGFYAGRVFGLVAASFVLVGLLLETRAMFARLARSLDQERAHAEARAAEQAEANRKLRESEDRLRQLNETLESRVAERSRQLEAEITERERIEEARREAQQLEVIGRLASGIAHDFNNLLTVVLGNAEVLLDSDLDPSQRDATVAVYRASERGARLVRQILTLSRRQQPNPEPIDLTARAPELSEMLQQAIRGTVRIVVAFEDGLWPVTSDVGELELALMNLCVNARDAMPRGGLIRIEGRNVTLPDSSADVAGLAGDFVALSVADEGTGIASDRVDHVFEPFYTTKGVGKGTGLGLAQVHAFAVQAGGHATIASTEGEGTTVTLYLPRSSSDAETQPDRGAAAVAGSGEVLVVEDDEDVAAAAMATLRKLGYSPHHVRDAGTALALLLGGRQFDIAFSDIVMPGGMNGVELALKLRQHFPRLAIVLASGFASVTADAFGAGFEVIAKPYSAAALSDALTRSLEAVRRSERDTG